MTSWSGYKKTFGAHVSCKALRTCGAHANTLLGTEINQESARLILCLCGKKKKQTAWTKVRQEGEEGILGMEKKTQKNHASQMDLG